jgi:hypothetical protein
MSSNTATLARDWLLAKQVEQDAIAARIQIEEQIAAALGVKAEGSETHNLPGYKVTLTQPVYRKVDEDAWKLVAKHCPADRAPVKYKLEADGTGIKWLMQHDPKTWGKIASAFESKPGKVGVKVDVVHAAQPAPASKSARVQR